MVEVGGGLEVGVVKSEAEDGAPGRVRSPSMELGEVETGRSQVQDYPSAT